LPLHVLLQSITSYFILNRHYHRNNYNRYRERDFTPISFWKSPRSSEKKVISIGFNLILSGSKLCVSFTQTLYLSPGWFAAQFIFVTNNWEESTWTWLTEKVGYTYVSNILVAYLFSDYFPWGIAGCPGRQGNLGSYLLDVIYTRTF